jgi:uncharacterized protein YjbJ (UPF0337 family)
MIRSIIKLGLILVAGIIAYNYFFGTPAEKESSEQIVGKAKDLIAASWGLLKSEKEKFDEGKYDEALAKVKDVFEKIKGRAQEIDDQALSDQVDSLEKRREGIQERLNEKAGELSEEEKKALKREFENLMRDAERMIEQQ